MCTLGDLFYVNYLVNRKAVSQKKRMFMPLVILLSAGFATNVRQLRGGTLNLSGTISNKSKPTYVHTFLLFNFHVKL
jgi:hypothetical protein